MSSSWVSDRVQEILTLARGLLAFHQHSISEIVRHVQDEYAEFNETRYSFEYSPTRKALITGAKRPLHAFMAVLFIYVLCAIVATALRPGMFGLKVPNPADYYRDLQGINAGVLGAQATLVGLVYPLVIALVGLLFDARYTTGSRMGVFFRETEALLTGGSALALCASIAIQMPLAGHLPLRVMFSSTALNVIWFLANLYGLFFFLRRSFDYIRPNTRVGLVKSYLVNEIWREEQRRILTETYVRSAVQLGYLPNDVRVNSRFKSDQGAADPVPSVSMRLIGKSNPPAVTITLKAEVVLKDIWFPVLSVVAESWMRRTNRQLKAGQIEKPARSIELEFEPVSLASYKGNLVLARSPSISPLNWVEKFLVRRAYKFQSVVVTNILPQSASLLTEAVSELIELIEKGRVQEFEASLDDLIDLHSFIIKVAESPERTNDGRFNYAEMRNSALGRRLSENWASPYYDLFRHAVAALPRHPKLFAKCAYAAYLLTRDVTGSVSRPITSGADLVAVALFWRLLEWAIDQNRTNTGRSANAGERFELTPQSGEFYEDAWRAFVAGWERQGSEYFLNFEQKRLDWSEIRSRAPSLVTHLSDTCAIIAGAAWNGDLKATNWTSDIFLKWKSTAISRWRGSHGRAWLLDKTLITTDLLALDWHDVLAQPLTHIDNQHIDPSDVFDVAIENRWIDSQLAILCILLSWIMALGVDGTAAVAARRILRNEEYDSTSEIDEVAAFASPQDLLEAITRIVAAGERFNKNYAGEWESLVDRLRRVEGRDLVPFRGYSSTAAPNDIGAYTIEQAILLVALATCSQGQPRLSEGLRRSIEILFNSDDMAVRRVLHQIEELKGSVASLDRTRHEKIIEALGADTATCDFERRREEIGALIEVLISTLKGRRDARLQSAEIDPSRLQTLATAASAAAFSKDTGLVPINLFRNISLTEEELPSFSMRAENEDRGLYTSPMMSVPVINEGDFWRDLLRGHVAQVVLADVLRSATKVELRAKGADDFWDAIRDNAAEIEVQGQTPILFVRGELSPRWLWDWRWGGAGLAAAVCPSDMRIWESDQQAKPGYLFNINSIQVFSGRIPSDRSYLLSSEMLELVEFHIYEGGQPVDVRFVEDPNDQQRGTLHMQFQRRVRLGHGRIFEIQTGAADAEEDLLG